MQLLAEIKSTDGERNAARKAPGGFFDRLIEPGVSPLLTRLSHFLAEQKVPSYIVGGFVRDMLLKRNTADIDIAVAADALEIARRVAIALDGKYIPMDTVNRIGRVVLTGKEATSASGQWELDFSTFAGSIEEDLGQRDFTIDAMAIELSRLEKVGTGFTIIDPFQGRRDLQQGIIRAVTRTVFESDAARLLRAIRLAYELGFTIDGETEALMQRYCHLITGIAGERVREELLRLLAVPQAEAVLPHLDRLGLLAAIVPELALEKGVEQPIEHFWNVFDHSLKTVAATDFLLRQGSWEYAGREAMTMVPWSAELDEHFNTEVSSGSTRRLMLKLAALLHDIAKPQTKAIDSSGRMRFLGHAKEGAAASNSIMERLRFSNREIKLVETMVEHHMRPTQMSQSGILPTQRAIYRYFRDTGDAGIDILFLSLADHLATRGPHLNPDGWREHTRIVDYVLTKRSEQEILVSPPRLIDGNDLINIFGLSPGPGMGHLLELVREAHASGEFKTREEALSYIRKHLENKAE
jgi:poly(A) polymerase